MGISGNLKTMVLAELLQWLSQGQKNGTLVIDNGKVEKRVFFKGGNILSSASTDPKEYLGHFLVSHGHISEEEVDQAVARQEEEKLLIGKILVDMGSITEEDLHDMLRLKAEESIYDIFTWEEAEFRFLDGELPEKTMIPMQLDVQWIVLEGSRRLDEWHRVRETIPSPLTVPVLVVDPETLEIEDTDRRILSWVDDDSTVEEISHAAKTSLFQVSQTLANLVKSGHVKAVRPRIIEVEVAASEGADTAREDTEPIPLAQPGMPYAMPAQAVPSAQQPYGTLPGVPGPYATGQFVPHPGMPGMAPQTQPIPQQPSVAGHPASPAIDLGGRTLHFAGPDPGTGSGYVAVGSPQPAHPPQGIAAQSSPQPTESETLLQQAEASLQAGEFDAALEKFRRAKDSSGATTEIEQKVKQGEEKIQKALEREGFALSAVPTLKCSMDELTKLSISPQEGFMLTRLNGSYDIKSLLKLSPMPALDAQLLFWQLSKSGHVAV